MQEIAQSELVDTSVELAVIRPGRRGLRSCDLSPRTAQSHVVDGDAWSSTAQSSPCPDRIGTRCCSSWEGVSAADSPRQLGGTPSWDGGPRTDGPTARDAVSVSRTWPYVDREGKPEVLLALICSWHSSGTRNRSGHRVGPARVAGLRRGRRSRRAPRAHSGKRWRCSGTASGSVDSSTEPGAVPCDVAGLSLWPPLRRAPRTRPDP